MSDHRMVRRLAFVALFQLDARGELTDDELVAAVANSEDPSIDANRIAKGVQAEAFELARAAFSDRKRCDDVMKNLSPEWPAYRQAAVDRALLRLAHFEMYSGRASAALAIDSAVELAKEFSTEKSPGFINALLDAAGKRIAGKKSKKSAASADPSPDPKAAPASDDPAPEEPS
ncbi:MAG TPA: transcription antitermination protein NusB [Phycisphaerales bacterium]